jgi:putative oxygen-independent coproporphyrinogen III oxidase
MNKTTIPLSLYIHLPWCIQKCPYCDFNSYGLNGTLPEESYIQVLLQDLERDLPLVQNRSLHSIFFGGGTPSLFSPHSIEKILTLVNSRVHFDPTIEITLEANPGTIEHKHFKDYQRAGINRISLGAQSFQNDKLQALGRIHDAKEIIRAIHLLEETDLKSFNIDIMYGLPNQTVQDVIFDLKMALQFSPPHLSWYQLTIEPNTLFHHAPPLLPEHDTVFHMQDIGFQCLKDAGLKQYEVSAFAAPQHTCKHNLNYWEFGDYLGIGAGAHGKITDLENLSVTRYSKIRYPKSYLGLNTSFVAESKIIAKAELPFEFMLNALRLTQGISKPYFVERTGIPLAAIETHVGLAIAEGLLEPDETRFVPTTLGKQFLNDLIALFLPVRQ